MIYPIKLYKHDVMYIFLSKEKLSFNVKVTCDDCEDEVTIKLVPIPRYIIKLLSE